MKQLFLTIQAIWIVLVRCIFPPLEEKLLIYFLIGPAFLKQDVKVNIARAKSYFFVVEQKLRVFFV